MRYLRAAGVAAAVAAAALVVTAVASAHPSVYPDIPALGDANTDPDQPGVFEPDPHTRHVVTNHGFTYVYRESNGEDEFGVLTYSRLPGDYRATIPTSQILEEGDTAAQAHATCRDTNPGTTQDVDALWTQDAITGWQVGDPFYRYVPFQATSAGLDDRPSSEDPEVSDWLDDVETLTGLELTPATNLAAACSSLGGEFVAADRIQTQAANLSSGLVDPLEAQIAGLETAVAAAEAARAAAEAARAAAQAAADAASARLAEVMPQLTPLSVTLGTSRATARRIARRGATATVTGPPLRTVTVRMQISQARAKKLGLRSRTLARKTVTTGADGKAETVLKPNRRTARRLQRLRGTLTATVGAVSGDRSASTRAVITRR
jgi:hypothetical protein